MRGRCTSSKNSGTKPSRTALGTINELEHQTGALHLLSDETKRFGELRRLLAGVRRGTPPTNYAAWKPAESFKLTATGAVLKPVFIAFVAMESGQQEEPTRFTDREQVGNSLVWQIKQASFRMLPGVTGYCRSRHSRCSDWGRIENVIWLNFSVHAVPLGINEPAG